MSSDIVFLGNASTRFGKREPLLLFIMRLNLKTLLLILTAAVVFIIFAVYLRCSDLTFPHELIRWDRRLYEVKDSDLQAQSEAIENGRTLVQDIECNINQEYSVHCKLDEESSEVYVPFSFLRNYFDVTGSVSVGNSFDGDSQVKRFNWQHTNAKINMPKGKYDPRGVFMYFENYNVEIRNRVKCISASDGVPISTQWQKRGYFYPTQIAQFALSHWSKNFTDAEPRIRVLEDGERNQADWVTPKSSNISRIWHHKFNTFIVQYETAIGYESAVTISNLNQTQDLVLSLDLLLVTNSSSVMVVLRDIGSNRVFRLHYVPANLSLSIQDENIYYGLGNVSINKWRHLTRDLYIDAQKSLVTDKKSITKLRRNEIQVMSVSFLGIGFFDNLTLSTYDHMAHFYDAAEWFVQNQDKKTGGWSNPVRRALNGFTELKPGWLSAMGQGHAISVLSRAYWHSGGDKRYLKAAAAGLKPFRVMATDGGVLTKFMDKYDWYEEYPTTPSSFVLNGFIFSLLGLYDLNSTAPANIAREAEYLFNQGMLSLKKMLLFYDTGSGTSYDLRHLSLGVAPNLARWDYHSTHVNQLLLLATIDNDTIISRTAERWKNYMFGKRAKHN